jgi:hypothetical protein
VGRSDEQGGAAAPLAEIGHGYGTETVPTEEAFINRTRRDVMSAMAATSLAALPMVRMLIAFTGVLRLMDTLCFPKCGVATAS